MSELGINPRSKKTNGIAKIFDAELFVSNLLTNAGVDEAELQKRIAQLEGAEDAAGTAVVEPDPIDANAGHIDDMINNIAKAILVLRERLKLFLNLKRNKDVSPFIDNPRKWNEDEWRRVVSRTRKLIDDGILLVKLHTRES